MIIKINEKNEVKTVIVGLAEASITVDNERTFKVEDVPTVSAREILCYNPESGEFYAKPFEVVADRTRAKALAEAREQAQTALKWLTDNDWKVNKRILGEWAEDDERWLEYLAGREQVRKDYDEATAVLTK